jgi:RNA polymerase sigma factor (sigma-70 family)
MSNAYGAVLSTLAVAILTLRGVMAGKEAVIVLQECLTGILAQSAGRAVPAAGQVQRRTDLGAPARRRRTGRPDLGRRVRPDGRHRRLRHDARRQVRDLLRAAHPRRHARRTAHDGLGAAPGALQGQQAQRSHQDARSPLGRHPTEIELAEHMGLSVEELEKMMIEANAVNLISLNKKWYETDSYKDVREIDILEDKKGEDPTRRIQKNDLMRLVTKGLNRNERLIIILYYYEELTMKEIGATLDLSESRVSQMHSSIVS